MASINMDAILAKAKAHMGSKDGKNKVNTVVNKLMLGNIRLQSGETTHSPEEAATKFIEVLRRSIESSGLSTGAIEAVSNIEHGSAHQLGDSNTYIVSIYFTGDLSRPSLDTDRYPKGVRDIVNIFNYGAPKDGHKMHPVYGEWHGTETWSRTVIPGAHFIEQAVTDFMGNYASEYNVINISVEEG